ncbi:MAG: hypothetical protein RIQ46_685 [Pseudomonadota bacterium]
MRYTPAAMALSLLLAVTASASWSAQTEPMNRQAGALLVQGRTALASGNVDSATDAFEAALAVQPGHPTILLALADATRRHGMQGKAIHYYRRALEADPANVMAIAGEGAALVEKGAVERARRNLSRLEGLCGSSCEATRLLASAIEKGPTPRVITAEAVTPKPAVSEN